jgi:hypothetical protein
MAEPDGVQSAFQGHSTEIASANIWPFPALPMNEAELKAMLKGQNFQAQMSLANKAAVEVSLTEWRVSWEVSWTRF